MNYITLEKVNLTFDIHKERRIKDLFLPNRKRPEDVLESRIQAIRCMDLSISDGERVAIIGHNGAGKSSFLKLVCGIYPPTSGTLSVKGKISSMFELTTGFEMEQNGWDNIHIRGLMLGETPAGIRSKTQEIAEFSELGHFLDIPVKYYSSGMFVRLAFSVSTAIKPDILLLDEVVGAGDASFMAKAQQRMRDMMESSKIMILVTHSMGDAIRFCNRCLWFEHGAIVMDGSPAEVTEAYLAAVRSTS